MACALSRMAPTPASRARYTRSRGSDIGVPHLPIVRRMCRIVEMPALVPGTVGLREHLNGKVPILLVEELERQRRLFCNGQLQPRYEPLEIVGGCPVDIAIARQRIGPHPGDDLVRQGRR